MQGASRVLLTGGSGFVGRHFAAKLLEDYPSARRVAIVRAGKTLDANWAPAHADITDEGAIDSVVADLRPDLIIHLAAQSSVGQGLTGAEDTWRANFGGTLALSRAVARHAPQSTFFFASTSEVYGASFNKGIVTEETPPAPLSAYASSKAAAEHVLRDLLPKTTRLIIARAFNHTGPGQDERFVLPSFAAQTARIERGLAPPLLRVGNLEARRDFLDVRDVVDAYRALLRSDSLPERVIVNVGSGSASRIGDLLEEMRRLSTTAFKIEIDPARLRPSDVPLALGDSSLLKRATGWAPKETIQSTLRTLLDWWRTRVDQHSPQPNAT
jgi:GDP-4-dehydro-6-deoxy-D-mannose reductase